MKLRGLRTHNLKGIDLDLPLNRLIVVTGVSGSGKSSLAFDTIYAEGQRRYVETFSAYTRQFLERLDKPEAERIEGIPPAIAVGQSHGRHSGRSTVGTITEVHDALALLYARVGEVDCYNCGQRVIPATPGTVSSAIDALPEDTRYEIAFPVEILAETDRTTLLHSLRSQGFTRIAAGGQVVRLDEPESTIPIPERGSVDVIVDRLVRGKDAVARRIDSIESAFVKGLGRCRILVGGEPRTYTRGWRCSRCGTDHVEPQPNLFRFNATVGACPLCEGTGSTTELDRVRIIPDPSKSIREGAIAPWSSPGYRTCLDELLAVAPAMGLPVDIPFAQLAEADVERLFRGVTGSGFTGLTGFFQKLDRRAYKRHVRQFLNRWRRFQSCPDCEGARLRPEALAVRIAGRNIAQLSARTTREAQAFLGELRMLHDQPVARGLLAEVENRLSYLGEIGLDYLTLDRSARSLSGGELQRVVLTKALGSGLVNTLYVLDEPTFGLHPQESGRLTAVLHRLRDRGNTLVVVEHDAGVIRGADHVVDLGPGAGEAGGRVLYEGPVSHFSNAEGSATADYLTGRKHLPVPATRRPVKTGVARLTGARGNNLKSIDVAFPLGVVCAVTGVSGAGKSTLVEETLFPALRHRLAGESAAAALYDDLTGIEDLADAVFLDQSPLARSARSNPVTYLKVFDEIRKTFSATHEAKLRNYDAGKFSFNVESGRCNTCQGEGFLTIDMQFLPDVLVRCPDCRGTRYRPEVLEVTYRGRNIAEVLDLTAREAFAFFRHRPKIQARLRPLLDIGLDYLKLGQPASTLSGGEAQRLKLASVMGRSLASLRRAVHAPHTLFLLDEPTAGLHPVDILKLLEALNSLVDRGHSTVVITHNASVMLFADWIIDLGPGSGDEGGRVVAEGTPETVARSSTPTGEVLARALRDRIPTG
jgi:excinuclease ABC subunit A